MIDLLSIPYVQAAINPATFGKIVNPIIEHIVYPIIILMFGVALVIFVYGILQMIVHGSDEESLKKGKSTILYGTLGMFIMVSAWGIIYLISNTVIDITK